MKQSRGFAAATVVFVFLAALLLVAYVSGYFFLSEGLEIHLLGPSGCRYYPIHWLAVAYRPAAAIEGMIRGREIESLSRESWEWGTETP
jgi:hypothetical protein